VGNVRQHTTQNFIATPSLKSPMHRFLVRIALRQHVPLRTCVEKLQDRFSTRRVEIGFLENDSGCAPIARRSAESFDIYSGSRLLSNFEIGSNKVASLHCRPTGQDRGW